MATALQLERTARTGVFTLVLLSLGHFAVDMYSGAVGALQPRLVERLGLSLTQAGILGGVFIFASSVMQLSFGYLSDRIRSRLFAALGPAIAAVSISCLGLAPSYWWLVALVIAGGFGIASFHPQSSSAVGRMATARRGEWMAIFISSGTLGFALGPTYFTIILGVVALPGAYWAAVPGVLVTCLLLLTFAPPPTERHHASSNWQAFRDVRKPLIILFSLVFIRSILQITFAQFLPLYLHLERGFSIDHASYLLTLYLTAGAAGGFIGGYLSDRLGGRAVILISMAGCIPFLALFFVSEGVLAILGLTIGGLLLLFTIPVNVVMAQQLVPGQIGTVSALMMGFSWGTAGMIFTPLTGWASDLFGMQAVLFSLLIFPAIGFLLTLKLRV
ncbi:MAG: MFS transporter [bacterium]|nr:MFS transporter [bacterium]